MLLFLDIGGSEMLLIILVALVLFGGDKLPEVIRGIARGRAYIQNASAEVKEQINRETGITDAVREVKKTLDDTIDQTTKDWDDSWETVENPITEEKKDSSPQQDPKPEEKPSDPPTDKTK